MVGGLINTKITNPIKEAKNWQRVMSAIKLICLPLIPA